MNRNKSHTPAPEFLFDKVALKCLNRYYSNNLSVWYTEHSNCKKSRKKVLHTASAKTCFKEFICKVVAPAVLIVTKTIDTKTKTINNFKHLVCTMVLTFNR